MSKKKGFTFIEILMVISIIGLMLSVGFPISQRMVQSYKASLKAEEVMVFIATLKREAFLYSEAKVISSRDGIILVNGIEKVFQDTLIQIEQPIQFYKNGTTSGGSLMISVHDQSYYLKIDSPLGHLLLGRRD